MRKRLAGALLIGALVSGVVGMSPTPAATAGTSVGSFEIDGNRPDSPAGEPTDWEGAVNQDPPLHDTPFTDLTGQTDDSFGQGSKELAPSQWQCITSSSPGKGDITGGDIAFRTIGDEQFVYVDWTRATVSGDVHIDYEFSKLDADTHPNPSCPQLPQRTAGDIVITFDTENGGAKILVNAYRFTSPTAYEQLKTGSQGTTWDAATNRVPGTRSKDAGDYGEAVLNLTETIGNIRCNQFAAAYMKTRSSTSISAALQDRTEDQPIDLGNCPQSNLAKAVRNVTDGGTFATTAVAGPGDVIEYQLTYDNTGEVPATNVVISDTIQARQTFDSCSDSCATSGSPVNQVSWTLASVDPSDPPVVRTFQVVLDATFPSGATTVKNVAVVDTDEETPKNSNETTVTVNASVVSALAKAVRVLPDGSFVTTTTANTGDSLEYRLTYTNSGNAPATNVVISDTIQERQTFVSCSDSCSKNGPPVTQVSWTIATVNPGVPVVRTFIVTLDPSFPAGTTEVKNVGVVDTAQEEPKNSDETVVTVSAAPNVTIAKAETDADDQVTTGDLLTYTITYSNTGNAPVTGAVVTDELPTGTAFESCTGGCIHNNGTVTWNLGTIEANTVNQTLTVTVEVTASTVCEICNDATIAFLVGTEATSVTSDQACVSATPTANPAGASASGSATGVRIDPLDVTLPESDENDGTPETSVDSAQSGIGVNEPHAKTLISLPVLDVLTADVVKAGTRSEVAAAGANTTSVAETVAVDVLGGIVKASVVRAEAVATAAGDRATVSSNGSKIEGLLIDQDGNPLTPPTDVQNIYPGLRVELDDLVFGPDSYVAVYEEFASVGTPLDDSHGTYAADITVNMLRVHLGTGSVLFEQTDTIVSQAVAHADFPQTTLCGTLLPQSVSGDATIARVSSPGATPRVSAGYVVIPPSGGRASTSVNSLSLAPVSTAKASTLTTGTTSATSSTSHSEAEAARLCIVLQGTTCTISARLVATDADSSATSLSRSSSASSTFTALEIAGNVVQLLDPIAPNTVIAIPMLEGVAYVVLNEQVCDNGGTLTTTVDSAQGTCGVGTLAGHTGITVRAMRVVVLDGDGPTGAGTGMLEIVVAESHADSKFV